MKGWSSTVQFKVTAEDLMVAATNCTTSNDEIQGQIAQMRSYVLGLMQSYQGPAATALQSLSDEWGAAALQLNDVLGTISSGLTGNANRYVLNEQRNTSNLVAVASGLPPARL
jgi:WXG100 family type VII secretion target